MVGRLLSFWEGNLSGLYSTSFWVVLFCVCGVVSGKPFEKNLGRQNTCNPGMKVMTCGWPTDRNLEFRSIGVASSNMSWSKTDSFSLQVLTDLLVSLIKCEVYNFLRLPQPNKKMKHPKLVVLFGFDSRMQGFTTLIGTTNELFPPTKKWPPLCSKFLASAV